MNNLINFQVKETGRDSKVYDLDSGNFDREHQHEEYTEGTTNYRLNVRLLRSSSLENRQPARKPIFSKKYNPKKPIEGSCSNCRIKGMLNSEGLCLNCASKKYSLKSIESKN
tara:strand:- start:135 stop:470 length:336 start_codon:yes stop_codon:yes gene_type:complete